MADFPVSFQNGVNRSDDETRLPEGFARYIEGAVYMPDDGTRLFKIQGYSSALTLGSPQTTTPYGLRFAQFDTQSSQLFLLANSQLYRQTAAQTLSTWTSVNDLQGSPAAFSRAGTFLKMLPDGLNRWVSWTGAASERPLIHDEDSNVRFLSLKKPTRPTLSDLTVTPTVVRPTSSVTPSTVQTDGTIGVVVTGGFANPTLAYDGDLTTQATATLSANGCIATAWAFAAGTWSGQTLYVHLDTSSLPPYSSDPRLTVYKGGEPVIGQLYVRYSTNSTNGTDGTWTQIFGSPVPVSSRVVSFNLPDQVSSATLRVQVILHYSSGTSQVRANTIEIYRQNTTAGATTAVPDGTYYYVTTEVYQVTLASGQIYETESAPSDTVFKTYTNNTTVFGVQVTLPAQINLATDGVAHDPANNKKLFRRIYRSTKSGVWPDLGFIGEAAIADTTFNDTFIIDSITLGTPSIYTVFAGTAVLQAAGQAPAFFDATVTKGGVIVAIPANDRYRIQWCMPGQPDYWPLPAHDLSLLPSVRNDKLVGVTAINDAILLFLRTRVVRLVDLPLVNQPNFDQAIRSVAIDILSPNEGLAGTPMSYCSFESQKGRGVVAWVSDNGLWMTDGTLLSERGMGIVKLSVNMDWEGDVDKTRLNETALTFDPVTQMIYFEFYDQSGNHKMYLLHTHPDHWIDTGQDMAVPKVTGLHPTVARDRALGEQTGGGFFHWILSATDGKIYNERTGSTAGGSNIVTHIESGWLYPAGPMSIVDNEFAGVYHNNWGSNETCDLNILFRRDKNGIIQTLKKSISLAGSRVTRVFARRSAQSIKLIIRHVGITTSSGSGQRAFGPVVLDVTDQGEVNQV